MALSQFLGQLENPQVAFSVQQKRPTTLIEAVGATIEMESYLKPKTSHIAQEQSHSEAVIAHQTRCYDGNAGKNHDKTLEACVSEGQPVPGPVGNFQSLVERDRWCATIACRRVTALQDV